MGRSPTQIVSVVLVPVYTFASCDPSPFYYLTLVEGTERRGGPLRQRAGRAGWSSYPTGVLRACTFQSCVVRRRCAPRLSCRPQHFEPVNVAFILIFHVQTPGVCFKSFYLTLRYRCAFRFYRFVRFDPTVWLYSRRSHNGVESLTTNVLRGRPRFSGLDPFGHGRVEVAWKARQWSSQQPKFGSHKRISPGRWTWILIFIVSNWVGLPVWTVHCQ